MKNNNKFLKKFKTSTNFQRNEPYSDAGVLANQICWEGGGGVNLTPCLMSNITNDTSLESSS